MLKNVEYVFLDLGRVLFHLDYSTFFENLLKFTDLPRQEVKQTMTWNGLNIDFETGSISEATYYEKISEQIEFSGTREDFFQIWCTILPPISDNIEFAKELSQKFPVAIISNTNEPHVRHMEEKADLCSFTQYQFYSCRIGFMKPRKEIFEFALNETGACPENSLFIDDRQDHIDIACELGLSAHTFPEGADLREFWNVNIAR